MEVMITGIKTTKKTGVVMTLVQIKDVQTILDRQSRQ